MIADRRMRLGVGALVAALAATPPVGATRDVAQSAQPAPTQNVEAARRGDSFARLAQRAAAARDAGRRDEAIEHYRRALARKPSWLDGRWALATLLYERDEYAEARDQLARVVDARPQDGVARALKGLCEAKAGDRVTALADLQRADALGVPEREVRRVAEYHLATLLTKAGNPDAAFAVLGRFVARGEDDPAIVDAFGLAVLRLELLPEEIAPERREMVRLAGRGGYDMARARRSSIGRLAFEELVARYPDEPNVHYAFGWYLMPEDPDAAIGEFRRELGRAPDHYPSMLQIAFLETRRGNIDEALALAEQAVVVAPDVPAGRLVLGRALLDGGQTERAIVELEKGIALTPDNPTMHFALARAYQRAGRAADAERARAEFQRLGGEQ